MSEDIAYAQKILRLEADAISAVVKRIDEHFLAAVKLIRENAEKGHLVTSGVGKASFVAMKCSATFASTGIPSFFLHPTEALHGDLGRFRKEDIALLLSHSGSTIEVLNMLPVIKRIGCKIISITSNATSELATHSDVVIETGAVSEACPLGLAPTTSSAVMLAVCDALSMTVLNSRKFSKEEFALFHPAGQLGRNLTPVKDIMRVGKEHCIVEETATAQEVLSSIFHTPHRPGAASIVNKAGELRGVFTDGDFRRNLMDGTAFLEKPISDVMTTTPKTIPDSALASEALRIMSEKKIDQLIVIDTANKPVGMIDIQDIAVLL